MTPDLCYVVSFTHLPLYSHPLGRQLGFFFFPEPIWKQWLRRKISASAGNRLPSCMQSVTSLITYYHSAFWRSTSFEIGKEMFFDYSRYLCHPSIEGLLTPINLVKKTIIPTFYKLIKHKGIPNNLYKFVLKHHNKYMFTVSC